MDVLSDSPLDFNAAMSTLVQQWRSLEAERSSWTRERAELQGRINSLEKDARTHERVRADLARRVQMLEYGIRMERAKLQQSQRKTQAADLDSVPEKQSVSSAAKENRRALLSSKYFTLPIRPELVAQKQFARKSDFLGESKRDSGKLVSDGADQEPVRGPSAASASSYIKKRVTLKEKKAAVQAVAAASGSSKPVRSESSEPLVTSTPTPATGAENHETPTVSSAPTPVVLTVTPIVLDGVNTEVLKQLEEQARAAEAAAAGTGERAGRIWKPKLALRNHLDAVRSVCFDDSNAVLLSGSEDGSAKLWNLSTPLHPMNRKKVFTSLEPLYTFSGHRGMVTSVAIDSKEGNCYTAGIDSHINVWQSPPLNQDPYASLGRANHFKRGSLAHGDAVWDMALHLGSNLLFSACADGLVYAWKRDASSATPAYTIKHPHAAEDKPSAFIPASVCVPATDSAHVLIAYTNGHVVAADVETGRTLSLYQDGSASSTDGNGKRITKVACHPTLGLAFTGHADHNIRFWDIKQGACVSVMKAHRDAVTSVSVDPSGLYLASGGHDQSIRFWDLTTQKIVQDLDPHQTHRSKYDEAVHSVVYHPTLPVVASGGADSVVKVYTS